MTTFTAGLVKADACGGRPAMLVVNPSADVYGADLQMLESVSAMIDRGWRVAVATSGSGPLTGLLTGRGAEVLVMAFPVLRRANASPLGMVRLAREAAVALPRMRRLIIDTGADVVYVNTVTVPWWLIAAKLAGLPSVCHVHEAESADRKIVLTALNAPLTVATAIISNSRASIAAMCGAAPWLRRRTHLVYNGIAGPPTAVREPQPTGRTRRLVVVGRLSPRKAPDIALEVVARLREAGRDVELEVCGTPFEGYEWYAEQLRQRAERPDLAGAVTWSGYASPIWAALARADVVLAPSLREPFGNAVIEAQLALRPVVGSAALGHLETITDGVTGLLVPPGDVCAMAAAAARILDDPALAAELGRQGRAEALSRFSPERYGADIADVLASLAGRRA